MAESFTIKIDGLAALNKALSELPERVAKNGLRAAVAAGARVIRDEAKTLAPRWTGPVSKGHPPAGTLQRSIIIKQIPEQSDYYKQVYYVAVRHGKKYAKQGKKGALSQDAFYWSWVEFGHYSAPPGKHGYGSRQKLMRSVAGGSGNVAGSMFVPAQPFLRPAFTARRDMAVAAIKDKLAARIEQAAGEVRR